MTDKEWFELVKSETDEGWKLVWERVIAPESRSQRLPTATSWACFTMR